MDAITSIRLFHFDFSLKCLLPSILHSIFLGLMVRCGRCIQPPPPSPPCFYGVVWCTMATACKVHCLILIVRELLPHPVNVCELLFVGVPPHTQKPNTDPRPCQAAVSLRRGICVADTVVCFSPCTSFRLTYHPSGKLPQRQKADTLPFASTRSSEHRHAWGKGASKLYRKL